MLYGSGVTVAVCGGGFGVGEGFEVVESLEDEVIYGTLRA